MPQRHLITSAEVMAPLPRLQPADLEEASKAFAAKTAQTYDGFHPIHYSTLSGQALECIGWLLERMEAAGHIPIQIQIILIVLLSKPTGDFRPLGLFPQPIKAMGDMSQIICNKMGGRE